MIEREEKGGVRDEKKRDFYFLFFLCYKDSIR